MKIDEHRKLVSQHLEYIKERVDDNAAKLDRINGRVRKNERDVSFIKGIGSMITILFGFIMYIIKGD